MPKSKIKVERKYKQCYEVLKKKYEEVCQKNLKFVEINGLYHLAEQKWRKENSYLRQENSLEVSRVMKLRKNLEDKEKEVTDLKKKIEQLKEKL